MGTQYITGEKNAHGQEVGIRIQNLQMQHGRRMLLFTACVASVNIRTRLPKIEYSKSDTRNRILTVDSNIADATVLARWQ